MKGGMDGWREVGVRTGKGSRTTLRQVRTEKMNITQTRCGSDNATQRSCGIAPMKKQCKQK